MQPFKALTHLVQRLDSTTISVSGPAFIQLLDQLDNAIDYMDSHVSDILINFQFQTSKYFIKVGH